MQAEQRQSGSPMPDIDWRAEVNALGHGKRIGAFEGVAILLVSCLAFFPVLFLVTLVAASSELWLGVLLVTLAAAAVTAGMAYFGFMRHGHAR